MTEPLIIENFLPKSYQDELEQILTSSFFPWIYQSNTDYITEEKSNQLASIVINKFKSETPTK